MSSFLHLRSMPRISRRCSGWTGAFGDLGPYIPVQQHLSTSFLANLQNSFPFFCCSQQHVFTSLPVSVQVIFDEAANVTLAITIITVSGSHLFSLFITSPPIHLFSNFTITMISRTIKRRPTVSQTHIGQPIIMIHHLLSGRARLKKSLGR